MTLWRIAKHFLYVGSTAFGGPLALIGLMEERVVEREKLVTHEDFAEGVALGNMLPGPVAVDCATHIGYRLRGLLGAAASTLSLIAPATLLMLVITPLYLTYGKAPRAEAFLNGTRAAVVAVIISVTWRMCKKAGGSGRRYFIMGLTFALTVACRVPPLDAYIPSRVPVEMGLIVLSAVLGLILCAPGGKPAAEAGSGEGGRNGS